MRATLLALAVAASTIVLGAQAPAGVPRSADGSATPAVKVP